MRAPLVVVLALAAAAPRPAAADDGKLALVGETVAPRAQAAGKDKRCCGYPIVGPLAWALRFYWLAREDDFDEPDEIDYADVDAVDLYDRRGFYVGSYSAKFVWHLRMEGSGLLSDGRVINYAGACNYGTGTCFQLLDHREFPFGRGARRRTLVPFKSVAVDPRIVKLGEVLYLPEFDGLPMPDGSIHDGCVRADDTGGGIKVHKLDFFVVSYGNFRTLLQEVWGVNWVTPHLEAPRCQYLRHG
jgi:3D (Asp-Asp-Asp) domain-containing protein